MFATNERSSFQCDHLYKCIFVRRYKMSEVAIYNVESLAPSPGTSNKVTWGNLAMMTAKLPANAAAMFDRIFDTYVPQIDVIMGVNTSSTATHLAALQSTVQKNFQQLLYAFIVDAATPYSSKIVLSNNETEPSPDAVPNLTTLYVCNTATVVNISSTTINVPAGGILVYDGVQFIDSRSMAVATGMWKLWPTTTQMNPAPYNSKYKYTATAGNAGDVFRLIGTYPASDSYYGNPAYYMSTLNAINDVSVMYTIMLMNAAGMPPFQSFRTVEKGFELNLLNNWLSKTGPSLINGGSGQRPTPNCTDTENLYMSVAGLSAGDLDTAMLGLPVVLLPDAHLVSGNITTILPITQLVLGFITVVPDGLEISVTFPGMQSSSSSTPVVSTCALATLSNGNHELPTSGPFNSLIQLSKTGLSVFVPSMFSVRAYMMHAIASESTPLTHPFQANRNAGGQPAIAEPTTLNNLHTLDFFEAIINDVAIDTGGASAGNAFGFDITAVDQFQFNLGFCVAGGDYVGGTGKSKWLTSSANTSKYVNKAKVKQYLLQSSLQNIGVGDPTSDYVISWAKCVTSSEIQSGGVVAPANVQALKLFDGHQLDASYDLWKVEFSNYMLTYGYPWIHYNKTWYFPTIVTGTVVAGSDIIANCGLAAGDSYQMYLYAQTGTTQPSTKNNGFIIPFNNVIALNGGTNVATGLNAWYGDITNKTLGAQIAKMMACMIEANVVPPPPDNISASIMAILSGKSITSDPIASTIASNADLLALSTLFPTWTNPTTDSNAVQDEWLTEQINDAVNVGGAKSFSSTFAATVMTTLNNYGISTDYLQNRISQYFTDYPNPPSIAGDTRYKFNYIDQYSKALLGFGNHFYTYTYGDQLGIANFIEYGASRAIDISANANVIGATNQLNINFNLVTGHADAVPPTPGLPMPPGFPPRPDIPGVPAIGPSGGGALAVFNVDSGAAEPVIAIMINGDMITPGESIGVSSNSITITGSGSSSSGISETVTIASTTTGSAVTTDDTLTTIGTLASLTATIPYTLPAKTLVNFVASTSSTTLSFSAYVTPTLKIMINNGHDTKPVSAATTYNCVAVYTGGYGTASYTWKLGTATIQGPNARSSVSLTSLANDDVLTCTCTDQTGTTVSTFNVTIMDVTLAISANGTVITSGQLYASSDVVNLVATCPVSVIWTIGSVTISSSKTASITVTDAMQTIICNAGGGVSMSVRIVKSMIATIDVSGTAVISGIPKYISSANLLVGIPIKVAINGGYGTKTFTWKRDGILLSGATDSFLTVPSSDQNVQSALTISNGNLPTTISVTVTDTSGSTAVTVILDAALKVTITSSGIHIGSTYTMPPNQTIGTFQATTDLPTSLSSTVTYAWSAKSTTGITTGAESTFATVIANNPVHVTLIASISVNGDIDDTTVTFIIYPHIASRNYTFVDAYGLGTNYGCDLGDMSNSEALLGLLLSRIYDLNLSFHRLLLDKFGSLLKKCVGSSIANQAIVQNTLLTSTVLSAQIYAILYESDTSNKAVSERLLSLLILASFNSGYRIASTATGTGITMRWILDDTETITVDSTNGGPYICDGENILSTWLSTCCWSASRPYDLITALTKAIATVPSPTIWKPCKKITNSDILTYSGTNSTISTNNPPMARITSTITVAHDSPLSMFNVPILAAFISYAGITRYQNVDNNAVIKRWVSLLMSDVPWIYYDVDLGATTTGVSQFGTFNIPVLQNDELDVKFEQFWDYRSSLVANMRQVLQASIGFNLE